ncbi:hypothetical protein [Sphingomonas arenae]|uniref:hypothetical protein n=1 Tax=Sphingomonas arenae TaxID=2812555 RepID=UPI001967F63D|nr:hypothetical protein [Sphingomonas arenae]
MSVGFRALFLLSAAALLSSCSPPPIDIVVEKVGERLLLRLSQDWGVIFSSKQVPCVGEISIHTPEVYDRSKAAWAIEPDKTIQCLDLASVTVGVVPDRWKEVVPLTVESGRTYTVEAYGIGSGRTDVRF